jgi:anti-sigma regulatory factor (Ser/Thr protein kinase)
MRLLSLRVPCDESAPAAARGALSELRLLGWVIGDLIMIASELVTNAILYSGCDEHDEIELSLDQADRQLLLSVLDPGRSGKTARLALDEDRASGGLGLVVVDHLASRWGADRSDRYRVWAEIPLAPTD